MFHFVCVRGRLLGPVGAVLVFLAAARVAAQDAPPSAASAEELQQINAALKADADAKAAADARSSSPAAALSSPAPSSASLAAPGAASWPGASLLQSMNPDLSVILDVAAAAFSSEHPEQLGGHDPSSAGFNLQQLEMHFSANVDPFFRFDGNLVYTLSGVEIEEAYATSLALPGNLQVRAGQFLTRFGRINSTHPHSWHFADQPLVLGKFFGGDGNRGVGAELSWLSALPWYLEVVLAANQAGGGCCGRSYFPSDTPAFSSLADPQYTGAVKQFFPLSDDWSLLWGISGQTAPNAWDRRTAMYGTDLYLRWRPVHSDRRQHVSLQAEAILRDRWVPNARLQDVGGYAQLVWGINQSWELGGRGELVTGVANDPIEDDEEWNAKRMRYALQATYYPTHFSRIRVQGSVDQPPWHSRPIFAGFLAFEVVVGQHGSHNY